MPILDLLYSNGAQFIAFAIGYVICALVPTWRIFRIAAIIVVVGIVWQFLTLFQIIPPQVTNLVLVAALSPGWIGAAGGLVVRAYQLQQPAITTRTRVITAAIGFAVFALIAWLAG
jgi:hypothetical protein